jgi:hypothetical protein
MEAIIIKEGSGTKENQEGNGEAKAVIAHTHNEAESICFLKVLSIYTLQIIFSIKI